MGAGFDVAGNRVRLVQRLELFDVARRERYIDGCNRIIELFELRGANDRRNDTRFAEYPGQCGLRRFDAEPRGRVGVALHDVEIGWPAVQHLREFVGVRAHCRTQCFGIACEVTTCERPPREETETL